MPRLLSGKGSSALFIYYRQYINSEKRNYMQTIEKKEEEYALFILNIIKKLSVLNTKTSDGNENRWRQKKGGKRNTENESENETATNLSLFFYFYCHFFRLFYFSTSSSVVYFQHCTCTDCVPSCFEFLGFAAHITFISVQKPHHNCYLLFCSTPKVSPHFPEPYNSIL